MADEFILKELEEVVETPPESVARALLWFRLSEDHIVACFD
jgi:hypothetical protein